MSQDDKKEPGEISRREFLKDATLIAGSAAIGSAGLLAATPAQTASAQAAAANLEVLDPSGAYEVTKLFAKRLDNLNGKTVCMVSNNIWQSWRTFPLIGDLLKKQYPTVKIVSWEQFGSDFESKPTEGLAKMKALGCDAAIVGNAG